MVGGNLLDSHEELRFTSCKPQFCCVNLVPPLALLRPTGAFRVKVAVRTGLRAQAGSQGLSWALPASCMTAGREEALPGCCVKLSGMCRHLSHAHTPRLLCLSKAQMELGKLSTGHPPPVSHQIPQPFCPQGLCLSQEGPAVRGHPRPGIPHTAASLSPSLGTHRARARDTPQLTQCSQSALAAPRVSEEDRTIRKST